MLSIENIRNKLSQNKLPRIVTAKTNKLPIPHTLNQDVDPTLTYLDTEVVVAKK
jgi:hypothetical protein